MTRVQLPSTPSLYGIKHSSRDFSQPTAWGKNQFNNAFPVALLCYLGDVYKSDKPVLIHLTNKNGELSAAHNFVDTSTLLGQPANSDSLFFKFEDSFTPYTDLLSEDKTPKLDLVIRDRSHRNTCLAGFEIKLTALPDNSTHIYTDESRFGSEIVMRPPTIPYIAFGIIEAYERKQSGISDLVQQTCETVQDWGNGAEIKERMLEFKQTLNTVLSHKLENQKPLMLQPIFKTKGKQMVLEDYCFDYFVWTDFALTRLFMDGVSKKGDVTRQERTLVWLLRMLYDFSRKGQFNYSDIIKTSSFNFRNDKAFACNGSVTNKYMRSPQLTKPRFRKEIIRDIILGGGQKFLSPERRLDAILVSSPDLFQDAGDALFQILHSKNPKMKWKVMNEYARC
jgi:HindVP restriction endonuclease